MGDNIRDWCQELTDRELRALVHEVGQRLVTSSRVYEFQRSKLEKMANDSDYRYFGLTQDAEDKELDAAYRKKAKKMHPDKNGGTEEAKEAFQEMKGKYERLKKRRSSTLSSVDAYQTEEEEPSRKEPQEDPQQQQQQQQQQ